jgi:indole-3-glycerol phosphate synthase
MTAGILGEIVAKTRERLRAGAYSALAAAARRPEGARFATSLSEPGTRIIAEIKRRSPSAGEILPDADGSIETIALAYRRGRAAAISVVTEPEFFGGNSRWIERARRVSGLPVLLKDFVMEEEQLDFAVSAGADAVLLIAAILEPVRLSGLISAARGRGLGVVVEAHDSTEVRAAVEAGAPIIGVNARDLTTFATDPAGAARLAAEIPADRIALAESGMRSRADLETMGEAGFRAFLVGEALLRSEDPEALLREMRGAP